MMGTRCCRQLLAVLSVFILGASATAHAQDAAATLENLLRDVRNQGTETSRDNQAREQAFRQQRDQQKAMLDQTLAELRAEQARSDRLKARFDANEQELEDLNESLRLRIGDMGELFGIVRQMAGDTKGIIESSLVTPQYPNRGRAADKLAQSTALPSIADLRALQVLLLEEMVESGKVVRFETNVDDATGVSSSREVVRVGLFNVISDEGYLAMNAGDSSLSQLPRQPAGRYVNTARDFFDSTSGNAAMAIDPSRGALLSLVIQAPGFIEQVQYGGSVGYAIIAMGVFGLVLAALRLLSLHLTGRRMAAQLKSETVSTDNPLGRVLATYSDNKSAAIDTLELKMDEAILREAPKLERFQGIIKVIAGVAPLMGLLGTVVGMIRTFQSITLFGTGDPKLMADGISQALVTTVEGLVVAIPLVFMHSLISGKSRALIEILEEQSAGVIARYSERSG